MSIKVLDRAGMTGAATHDTGLGWGAIVRLGLVQSAIGAMIMVCTSLLNRVMVVEYAMAAAIPAALVGWHYAVQLSRPLWGQGSDVGGERTPWIITGMGILAVGVLMAVNAVLLSPAAPALGTGLAILAFSLIGVGVGAAGTSTLALLASRTAPARRPAAAALTWVMMVAGVVASAIIAGALLEPFSAQRLALVTGGVVAVAFALTCAATWRLEIQSQALPMNPAPPPPPLRAALDEIFSDPAARRFTLFVFISMLAYSMQDLILEPFAGLMFGMTPGQSTSLSGMQHGGVLVGMIVSGVGGSAFAGRLPGDLRAWIFAGCIGSALALAGLALAAQVGPGWPLELNCFVLGLCNGVFAVAAIGSMMGMAGQGKTSREGVRMGVWGAAQAIAFGLGGLIGAVGVDVARTIMGSSAPAFSLIFAAEAALFIAAGILAMQMTRRTAANRRMAHG